MPLGAGLLKLVKSHADTALAATPNGQFRHEHREPKEQQKPKVGQHKGRAAVLPRDVGETPHVAKANGTARGNQQKSKSSLKSLALSFMFHNV